jgi:hypothetical protein
VIPLWKWSEAVDTLECVHGGDVEAGRSAFVFDAGVRGSAVAVDVEDDRDTLTLGGAGVCLLGEPVFGYLAIDDVDVVGETGAEGAVGDGDAGGAVFELHRGLGDSDSPGLSGDSFVGLYGHGLDVLGRLRRFLFSGLHGLVLLGLDGEFVGRRWRYGLFFFLDGRGAWLLGGEDAGVESALARRQRQRRDHGGLNGSGTECLFAPGAALVRQQRQADESAEDRGVQREGASEITGQVFADALVAAEIEWSGYDTLTFPAVG